LCELFGSELRGHNFLEGWNSEDRPTLQRCLASVCEQGAVVVLALAAGDQRRRLELETILLPLLYGNGISRVLGAMSGVSDQWPAREPIGHRRLLRAELLWPDGRKSGLPQRAVLDAPSPAPAGVSAQRRFRVLEGGLGKRE